MAGTSTAHPHRTCDVCWTMRFPRFPPAPPPLPFPAPLRAADGHRGFAVFCRTDSKGVPQPWSIFWLCDRGCVVTGAKISPGCGVGHCGECGIRGAGSDRNFGRAETNPFTRGRGVHLIQTSLCVFI